MLVARTTAISGAVITAVVIAFFVRENVAAEWRGHQAAYERRLAGLPDQAERLDEFDVKLRQVFLEDLDRVDRCTSCHVGIEDPAMADAPQPLTAHPGDYLRNHDVERFGCTVCHDGQGRATIHADSKARPAHAFHFERPMLKAPFLQARCYRCHERSLDDTPVYNKGRELFESAGCMGCHRVGGQGGALGPALDGLSDKAPSLFHPTARKRDALLARTAGDVNLAWILESVQYPAAQPETPAAPSSMFDFGLSDGDALAMTVYLKGLETAPIAARDYIPREARPLPADPVKKGEILYARFCSACHGAGGKGGRLNPNSSRKDIPNLTELNERMQLWEKEDADDLFDVLHDPDQPLTVANAPSPVTFAQVNAITTVIKKGNPSGKKDKASPVDPVPMPAWEGILTDSELNAVLHYLVMQGEWEDDEEDSEDSEGNEKDSNAQDDSDEPDDE